jgi:ethanolamine ammonia-lyase small subunit
MAVDAAKKAEMQMDTLEALADAWAEEADITTMITNATSPMALKRDAPADVLATFHERMKSHVYNLMTQAFIEGAVRGVDLVNDELRRRNSGS